MAVNLEVLVDQPERARDERNILENLARDGEDACFLTPGEKTRLVALKLGGRPSSHVPEFDQANGAYARRILRAFGE